MKKPVQLFVLPIMVAMSIGPISLSSAQAAPTARKVETCQGKASGSVLIDLKKQRLYVCDAGNAVYSTPVITGAAETPTMVGVFPIQNHIEKKALVHNYFADDWFGLGIYTNQRTGQKTRLNFGIHTDVRNLPADAWKYMDQLNAKGFGSSACINVPKPAMDDLVKILRPGDKVYIF